jgi:hypothetical protein
LVALSQEIDQSEAERIVSLAGHSLLNNFLTVGQLHELLVDRFGTDFSKGPPEGGVINRWRIVPGETALAGRQNSRWKFETTVIVEVAASRTISSIPTIREQWGQKIPFATSLSETVHLPRHLSGISLKTAWDATSRSDSNVLVYSVGEVLKSIGRHTTSLVWSATLSSDQKLTDFEILEVKYQGVVWA